MRAAILLLLSLCFAAFAAAIPSVDFKYSTTDSKYSIGVNGVVWLTSADTFISANSKIYSTADGSLKLVNTTRDSGADVIGMYTAIVQTYTTADSYAFETTARLYSSLSSEPSSPVSTIRAIAFQQRYLASVTNAHTTHTGCVSSYPAFQFKSATPAIGYHQFNGGMFTDPYDNVFGGADDEMRGGIEAGPLALFDSTGTVAAFIAPLTSFMDTVLTKDAAANAVRFGIQGDVDDVTQGYTMETLIYFNDDGVGNTIVHWGDIMLRRYGKSRAVTLSDLTNHYIGYSTDNGAYYYYNQEPGKNYQDTMLDVHTYLRELNIPIRYSWMDSWRYYHYNNISTNGVIDWGTRPDIYPSGTEYVHDQIRLPWVAHNKWWSSHNVYAKENGGKYNFVLEETYALPVDQQFWTDLFQNASLWGLHTYEQDWLSAEAEELKALSRDLGLGRLWLTQMGEGAAQFGMTIQMCMAMPRQVLQSVECGTFTSFRASADYLSAKAADQWQIGQNNAFGWALGIMPFKDNWRSTSVQPDNKTEPNPDLQSVIAVTSMGPNTPSDGIGFMNVSLVYRTIRSDGVNIRPDRSAILIDAYWAQRAFFGGPFAGEVTHTYTSINGYTWHIVLAAQLSLSFTLTLAHIHAQEDIQWYIYRYNRYQILINNIIIVNSTSPLNIPVGSRDDFSVYYFSPKLSNGIIILGETSKWSVLQH